MSIARGIAKAVKAQSRGLQGKRNSQGDFETISPEPSSSQRGADLQIYINNAREQLDDIEAEIADMEDWLSKNPNAQEFDLNADGLNQLEMKRQEILMDLEAEFEANGVEVPDQVTSMIDPEVRKYYEDGGNPELANDLANQERF